MDVEKVRDKGRPVLVTTEFHGVFFGYAKNTEKTTVKLQSARCCISWPADIQGFMGLAAYGPNENCRIGPRADITVHQVTSVTEVVPKAVIAWENAVWRP